MTKINLSEAKNRLSELVREISETTHPVTITVHGRKEVILMSMDEYDGLLETIEILKDQNLVKKILASMQEVKRGEVVPFEKFKKDI